MLPRYFRGRPNAFIIAFRNGRRIQAGAGLSFWYWPFTTTISVIPMASRDAPFAFILQTRDHQDLTIQGALTFRIVAPLKAAELLDYTVAPGSHGYLTEDPEALLARVVQVLQNRLRGAVAALPLKGALADVGAMTPALIEAANGAHEIVAHGVSVESVHIAKVSATPAMQKALETDYREKLQQEADLAIYARRAAAVEEERKIAQSELNTQVELEQRREELVAMQAQNKLTLARADAQAEELRLDPYGKLPPQALAGLALKEWAAHAGTIGNLSITPDLLTGLVGWLTRQDAKPAAEAD